MSTAIKIENVSKRYLIYGPSQQGYNNLKEILTHGMLSLLDRAAVPPAPRELWALRNISLEIKAGELVGLIGRNGSGKSTLLKLLAQITKPTQGRLRLWGRLGSLLEVGAGFHPELTGRENVYLSGTLMGMSKAEVRKKFDEIVSFSEIESFIDMPVKRYSSGMYMRLAFSVAAHLDPDILLIDEALAVGDMAFSKKCLAKMRSFADKGITIILVSHNLAVIAELCNRCLFLESGNLIADGPVREIVPQFLHLKNVKNTINFDESPRADQKIIFRELRVNSGQPAYHGQLFTINITLETFHIFAEEAKVLIGFAFCTMEGVRLLSCFLDIQSQPIPLKQKGQVTFTVNLPALDLSPGIYTLDLFVYDIDQLPMDYRGSCAQIEILAPQNKDETILPNVHGMVRRCPWKMH